MNRLIQYRSLQLTLAITIALPFAAMPTLASAHDASTAPMSHEMAASPAPDLPTPIRSSLAIQPFSPLPSRRELIRLVRGSVYPVI